MISVSDFKAAFSVAKSRPTTKNNYLPLYSGTPSKKIREGQCCRELIKARPNIHALCEIFFIAYMKSLKY